MIKKSLNQNSNYIQTMIESIGPNFSFNKKPLNRLKLTNNHDIIFGDKIDELSKLKKKINSIENCNLKTNRKNIILGDGNINSSLMIVGEAPGEPEEKTQSTFQGNAGALLNKMLMAINIERKKIYCAYSVNFRTPDDRKPNSEEIKRYSVFLKEHIKIINPKIIILMGSTAMETVLGLNTKISYERGQWKEIIIKNKTFPIIITFSPSYLIRFPEFKKYSWEDLKKIKKKMQDLNITI